MKGGIYIESIGVITPRAVKQKGKKEKFAPKCGIFAKNAFPASRQTGQFLVK